MAGREVRTIVSTRSGHHWCAFEAYASGDYTLNQLAAELHDRGLTQRPTAKRAARPLPMTALR